MSDQLPTWMVVVGIVIGVPLGLMVRGWLGRGVSHPRRRRRPRRPR